MGIAIVGDFLNLDMENPKVILRGLVIAVAAYLTYGIGVTAINGFHPQDLIAGVPLLIFYAVLMRHLWPDLGELRLPALIYGLVLPFTLWRALSCFFGTELSALQATSLSLSTEPVRRRHRVRPPHLQAAAAADAADPLFADSC
jgi:uncharacterized membrane protein YhhN